MAMGVDSAAHVGALEQLRAAAGEAHASPVAVLAGGADVPYPASRRRLHAQLVECGCVVSELPPGFTAFRWCFVARNRLIAGLADLTVVVEAAERSGSLITTDIALRLGREIAAVPGPVMSPRTAGTNGLLRDGALLVRGVDDVLDALYGAGAAPRVQRAPGADLEPQLATLLTAVAEGHDTLGALGAALHATETAALIASLTELELRDLVRRDPGGRYRVRL
jgi:DNA processing protein